jgi:hypothetical protein
MEILRFGHGRLINSHEVRKRLDAGQQELGIEQPIPFSSEPAVLFDYKQSFVKASFTRPNFGAGTVTDSPGGLVEGVVVKTTDQGAEILDRAEGVGEGHYILKQASIGLKDGSRQEVSIYVAHPKKVLIESHPAYGKPHPEYLLAILTGGREQGFSADYLHNLAGIALQADYRDYVHFIAQKNNDIQILEYFNKLQAFIQNL